MEGTIRYVFGLIGAMLASLIIYSLFMAGQGGMYDTMNKQLGAEYLIHTGNNGGLTAGIREDAWNASGVEQTYNFIAYNEEEYE